MNPLKWRLHGAGPRVDLLQELVPEQFQPTPTAFERAAARHHRDPGGPARTSTSPGLTRAVLRGGTFVPSFSIGDLVDGAVTACERRSAPSSTPTTANST